MKRDQQRDQPLARPQSPFNIYNTDIVKMDARAATMTPNGDLVRQSAEAEEEDLAQFALIDPDYQVSDRGPTPPTDSVIVASVLESSLIS